MQTKSVLAIAAHPDDIEFVMAGTLMQLAQRGWQVHYFNLANGCYGSQSLPPIECAAVRLAEAQAAAALLPAVFYPPICEDMGIVYTPQLLQQVAAVVRQAKPSIVLTHAPVDYMEDHQNTARLAVSAAFCRGMPGFVTQPPMACYDAPVAVYHAQPHGNCTPLGEPVRPTHFVDVSSLVNRKKQLLAAHASQDQWLGASQGISAYLETMIELNRQVGQWSEQFELAEGWRQHLHLGFSPAGFDPLHAALDSAIQIND
jgi:LmbE family N-acetylglucosaminyl deacetylase